MALGPSPQGPSGPTPQITSSSSSVITSHMDLGHKNHMDLDHKDKSPQGPTGWTSGPGSSSSVITSHMDLGHRAIWTWITRTAVSGPHWTRALRTRIIQ
ncbi:hypothetical protein AVEN_617-1 [Araneus ventricosus]|uniref:Uncharacterized protein n=1 Tax=Araneus ventricosus TaxID=182803 RepID=A0A4Y2EL35_ARAVE|nr:hypothetical protein AVEN_617-1 [Araneus ventricosus]